MTIEDLRDGLSPQQAKALTTYGEARAEPIRGVVAVMNVIDNRVRDGRWGTTVNEVVFSPHQFSCFLPDDPNCAPLLAIGTAWLAGEHPDDDDIVLHICLWLAEQILPDVTNGSTHYIAASLPKRPAWTHPPARFMLAVGHHQFFKGVP